MLSMTSSSVQTQVVMPNKTALNHLKYQLCVVVHVRDYATQTAKHTHLHRKMGKGAGKEDKKKSKRERENTNE